MNVFVIISYGSVGIFRAVTREDFLEIVERIRDSVDGWGIDEHVAKCEETVAQTPFNLQRSKQAILRLLREIGVGTHESFQHGTGFNVVCGCE